MEPVIAKVRIPPNYDLEAIALAAGQSDAKLRSYDAGELVVEGVPQSALDTAISNYSDLPRLKRTKRKEILFAANSEYLNLFSFDGELVEMAKDEILIAGLTGTLPPELSAKRQQMRDLYTKRRAKFQTIKNATTEAQVQAITWTSTP